MTAPAVSLLLCTVRPSQAYPRHPEWDVIGKVLHDLTYQVDAPPFELVIVDGLHAKRNAERQWGKLWWCSIAGAEKRSFPIRHVPPRAGSSWVRMKKVAISAYRNTAIAAARGELCINLDDCCELPPTFVSTFWREWTERKRCAAMAWPEDCLPADHRGEGHGDKRPLGLVTECHAYGFSSFPRELALKLNGYDEAYDGGRGLEDMDFSIRLRCAGLEQTLVALPGFNHGATQCGHDPDAVDPVRPVVKCCNAAWQTQRIWRHVQVANRAELWTPGALRRLVGPCLFLHGEQCGHHGDRLRCAYYDDGPANGVPECAPLNTEARGFARSLDPEASVVLTEPPVIDLRELAKEYT